MCLHVFMLTLPLVFKKHWKSYMSCNLCTSLQQRSSGFHYHLSGLYCGLLYLCPKLLKSFEFKMKEILVILAGTTIWSNICCIGLILLLLFYYFHFTICDIQNCIIVSYPDSCCTKMTLYANEQ